ncbi:MAG: prepilin-type N-terminal cleavage/methylation domain-containing protein [Candidatus Accumulibacter sp.]|jgi:prepilin-type N-terminal cleavage/methylation domain-containing protein|nr:prepilin-type N-terminal cleavage/methylation domain-containing protein [Accumulibacter sp.]
MLPPSGPGPRGFTLVELLVVCGILATLAFTAWSGYNGVQESAEDDIAVADLRRVADALRRFKADTGYYPGQGPFVLATAGETGVTEESCVSTDGLLRNWNAAPIDDSRRDAWFASPANLALLFTAPTVCGKHPLAYLQKWNPESGRGWRGPYLDRSLRLWVDHGYNLIESTVVTGAPDGTGNPLTGAKILDVPAYGSGPRYRAAGPSGSCANQAAESGNCMLGWRGVPRDETGYSPGQHEIPEHARPFLVFGLANGDFPRVVYMGKDGVYGGRNEQGDPCRPFLGSDDQVLCLDKNARDLREPEPPEPEPDP